MRKFRALIALLLLAGLVGVPAQGTGQVPTDFTYVTMSDGITIAVSVRYPPAFEATDVDEWPTIFQMDGYGGGGSTVNPASYGNNYVTVYASVRGTGCSGGRFDLFDRRHASDGYEIIEDWIVKRPWSNGKVAIVGYSYPGLTGWMVASTDPPSVTAIGLGGLIDDLYRGIVFPGGVSNTGFPAIWTGAYRPAAELLGNAGRYASETTAPDPTCAANIAARPPGDTFENPFIRGLTQTEDGPWWHYRSTISWIRGITKPIHIMQHHQDEQTGPRGGWRLFEEIPSGVPKRLVATNGRHGATNAEFADRVAWLDCWTLHDGGPGCASGMTDPSKRVQLFFETTGNNSTNAAYVSSDFPLPETDWTTYYLRASGDLTESLPAVGEAAGIYASAPRGRQAGNVNAVSASTGLPDELTYELSFDQTTAIAGPITATLYAQSTGVDTDFLITLIDKHPDGQYEYLQRGMLRASHRAVDQIRSDRRPTGEIYRPHRPHTNTQPITPGALEEYLVEVFPVAHVFRANHTLLVKVSPVGATDPISELYAYPTVPPPSVNMIMQDAAHPSSITLPVMPTVPPIGATRPACGAQSGLRCITPVAG